MGLFPPGTKGLLWTSSVQTTPTMGRNYISAFLDNWFPQGNWAPR